MANYMCGTCGNFRYLKLNFLKPLIVTIQNANLSRLVTPSQLSSIIQLLSPLWNGNLETASIVCDSFIIKRIVERRHPTDSTVFASAGADDQVALWDLALEKDEDVVSNVDPELKVIFMTF